MKSSSPKNRTVDVKGSKKAVSDALSAPPACLAKYLPSPKARPRDRENPFLRNLRPVTASNRSRYAKKKPVLKRSPSARERQQSKPHLFDFTSSAFHFGAGKGDEDDKNNSAVQQQQQQEEKVELNGPEQPVSAEYTLFPVIGSGGTSSSRALRPSTTGRVAFRRGGNSAFRLGRPKTSAGESKRALLVQRQSGKLFLKQGSSHVLYAGAGARDNFMQMLHERNTWRDRPRQKSPRGEYLARCEKMRVVPESCGVIRNGNRRDAKPGAKSEIKLTSAGYSARMVDAMARAYATSGAAIDRLSVANNRLSNHGAAALIDRLVPRTKELDLSNNCLGLPTCKRLAEVMRKYGDGEKYLHVGKKKKKKLKKKPAKKPKPKPKPKDAEEGVAPPAEGEGAAAEKKKKEEEGAAASEEKKEEDGEEKKKDDASAEGEPANKEADADEEKKKDGDAQKQPEAEKEDKIDDDEDAAADDDKAGSEEKEASVEFELAKVDLSGNPLGGIGLRVLSAALPCVLTLTRLNLSRCGLTEYAGPSLVAAVHACPSLEELNVAWNGLLQATAIGLLQKKGPALVWLDLAWNNIGGSPRRGRGGLDIVSGSVVASSRQLLARAGGEGGAGAGSITASSPKKGKGGKGKGKKGGSKGAGGLGTIGRALGQFLKEDMTLLHLNLSHCGLQTPDTADLAKGLEDNHTLLGIHLEGNLGHTVVDAEGYLQLEDADDDIGGASSTGTGASTSTTSAAAKATTSSTSSSSSSSSSIPKNVTFNLKRDVEHSKSETLLLMTSHLEGASSTLKDAAAGSRQAGIWLDQPPPLARCLPRSSRSRRRQRAGASVHTYDPTRADHPDPADVIGRVCQTCWLCGGWQEARVYIELPYRVAMGADTKGSKNPVMIYFQADGFKKGRAMMRVGDASGGEDEPVPFEVNVVLPPGPQHFFLEVAGEAVDHGVPGDEVQFMGVSDTFEYTVARIPWSRDWERLRVQRQTEERQAARKRRRKGRGKAGKIAAAELEERTHAAIVIQNKQRGRLARRKVKRRRSQRLMAAGAAGADAAALLAEMEAEEDDAVDVEYLAAGVMLFKPRKKAASVLLGSSSAATPFGKGGKETKESETDTGIMYRDVLQLQVPFRNSALMLRCTSIRPRTVRGGLKHGGQRLREFWSRDQWLVLAVKMHWLGVLPSVIMALKGKGKVLPTVDVGHTIFARLGLSWLVWRDPRSTPAYVKAMQKQKSKRKPEKRKKSKKGQRQAMGFSRKRNTKTMAAKKKRRLGRMELLILDALKRWPAKSGEGMKKKRPAPAPAAAPPPSANGDEEGPGPARAGAGAGMLSPPQKQKRRGPPPPTWLCTDKSYVISMPPCMETLYNLPESWVGPPPPRRDNGRVSPVSPAAAAAGRGEPVGIGMGMAALEGNSISAQDQQMRQLAGATPRLVDVRQLSGFLSKPVPVHEYGWQARFSVFASRAQSSDAGALLDTEAVWAKGARSDWVYAVHALRRVRPFKVAAVESCIRRRQSATSVSQQDEMLSAVFHVVQTHFRMLCFTFDRLTARNTNTNTSTTELFSLTAGCFTRWLEALGLVAKGSPKKTKRKKRAAEPAVAAGAATTADTDVFHVPVGIDVRTEGKAFTKTDLGLIFAASNFESEGSDPDGTNHDKLMNRYEFICALVMIAVQKYYDHQRAMAEAAKAPGDAEREAQAALKIQQLSRRRAARAKVKDKKKALKAMDDARTKALAERKAALKTVYTWSVLEVLSFLKELGYIPTPTLDSVQEEQIDGIKMLALTDKDLRKMGMRAMMQRKQLCLEFERLEKESKEMHAQVEADVEAFIKEQRATGAFAAPDNGGGGDGSAGGSSSDDGDDDGEEGAALAAGLLQGLANSKKEEKRRARRAKKEQRERALSSSSNSSSSGRTGALASTPQDAMLWLLSVILKSPEAADSFAAAELTFRQKELYTPGVDGYLRYWQAPLKAIFKRYAAGENDGLAANQASMSLEEWIALCRDAGLLRACRPNALLIESFMVAQLFTVDHVRDDAHKILDFPDFLECICRLADFLHRPAPHVVWNRGECICPSGATDVSVMAGTAAAPDGSDAKATRARAAEELQNKPLVLKLPALVEGYLIPVLSKHSAALDALDQGLNS